MKNQGGEARVILVASDLAYYGRKSFSAYVASKHGVLGLTRCWAREFAPDIMINAICPGPIDTPMLRSSDITPDWVICGRPHGKRFYFCGERLAAFGDMSGLLARAMSAGPDEVRRPRIPSGGRAPGS